MTQVDIQVGKSGNDGQVPGAASRSRMSELVKGKGAINLLDYKGIFTDTFSDPVKAQRRFEGWCCRMKDNLIALSGIDLRPYQKEFSDKIIKSVVRNDGQMFLAEWARQSGKTETLASTAYAIATLFAPMRIGIFGPKQRQAALMWNRVKERFNADLLNNIGLEVEKYGGNTFMMSSGSEVHAITCGSGNIEGETFDLILIDETQKISRRMILSEIWPMGAETNATKVIIGTPHFSDCWFREQVDKLKDTPFAMIYDWRTAAKYSRNYRRSIKSQLEQMTPESDEFRTQYELEWILEEGMFLTEDDWKRIAVPPMMAPYISKSGIQNNSVEANKWRIRAGLDLAKSQDSTVLTVTGKYKGDWGPYHDDLGEDTIVLLDVVEMQNVEYPDQFDVIETELDRWGADSVGVDSTGVGDPVTDVLKRNLDQHVEGFRFSGQSKHDLYKHAERKIRVEEERDFCNFIIPKKVRERENLEIPMRKMRTQWLSLRKEYQGSRMSVSAPEDEHDDFPDSASLAMWTQDADYSIDDKRMTSSSPMLGSTGANAF